MSRNAYILPILAVFILAVVFGMPLFLSGPMHQGAGCPFMPAQEVACATGILEHVKHWQNAFAAVLVEALALCALALFFRRPLLPALSETGQKWRYERKLTPDRPTLLQELFARGILHRKEPHLFFANY